MESELGRVVDALPGLVWTALPDGQIDFMNQRWSAYTGLEVDASHGRGWQVAIHPDDLPRLLAGWRTAPAPRAPVETKARLRGLDGQYRWFSFRAHPVADASGQVVKWCGLSTDIDDRMQAEEALRASERRFRLIVDELPVLLSTATPDGELEQANRHYLDYFGATLEQLKAREAPHGLHPDDQERVGLVRRAAIDTGRPYEIECRRRRADGVYRWFYLRAFPLRDAEGRIALWYRLQIDIDDQKRAEALLAGEKQLLEMVAGGRPMSDILAALCRYVESTASGCYCSLVLVDPSGAKLQEAIAPSLAVEFNEAVRGWPLDRIGGPCVMAARDKIQVIMSDVGSDSRWRNSWRKLAQAHGLKSCWSTPIVSRAGQVLGTFALYRREPASPDASQLELIAQFTNIASIAIERSQRDAALRESEARRAEAERELQLTIDSIPAMVATYRADGSRLYINKRVREYTGRSSPEDWSRTVHPDDVEPAESKWRACIASGKPFEHEYRVRQSDGSYRWFMRHRVPLRDETGQVIRWYGVGYDIEDRKRAEEVARQSEARTAEAERELRVTLDSIPTITWRAGANGYVHQLNKRWFEYTGTTPEQVRGAGWKSCVHPDDVDRLVDIGNEYVATGKPIDGEARLRRHDGTYRWFLFRPSPAHDEAGRVVAWYGAITDIEDRKRAEEALRESELNLREMTETIPEMLWSATPDGAIDYCNTRFLKYTGFSAEAVMGAGWQNTIHPEDAERAGPVWMSCIATGAPYRVEVRTYHAADRTYRWCTASALPLLDQRGRILKWHGTIVDMHDWKQAQEELHDMQDKLAHMTRVTTMGQLTASIAHEVNQPLAGIVTNASTCLRMLAADPPNVEGARETARRTIRDGNRAADVIARLRALFSKKATATQTVDLNEAAREALALVSTDLLRSRISLRAELGREPLLVTGDRVQLQQVILNLIHNASDAMSGVDDRPRSLLVKTCGEEDERARLIVKDVGVGFEPQGANRLFDAFYTTKSGGMGIGLSVSRSIIENHGGKLWAEQNDGPGATFSFSIPRQATSAGDEGTSSAIFTRPTRGAQDLTRNTE
jgi:PAS domain S-box-containing protein